MTIIKLGDICEFINGGAWSDKEYVSSGLPVLKVSNCKPSGFALSEVDYLPYSTAEKYKKNKLELGDVIIATVGSHPNLVDSAAGRSCVVNSLVEGYYLNQNAVCLRTKDTTILDQGYLGYLSKYNDFQHFIQMRGRGAANQMRIAISSIKEYECHLPDIETQRRIASILSAYDDLIENNRKQIKLLEEAAQRLYKEWFVDLRFPGWETAEIVDGVPVGWKYCLLSDIAVVNSQQIGKGYPHEKILYVDLSSVRNGHILEYTDYNLKDAPGRAKRLANDGDIIWGMVRPNLCSYALVMHPNDNDVFSTGFAVITAIKVPFSFLYCLVTQKTFIGYLVNCTNGAAYPAVKPIHFENAKVLKPTNDLLVRFHEIAEPYFRKIELLDKQIVSLSEARDRLLPKLMSGELEV